MTGRLVRIRGKVQGVWYRAWTVEEARRRGLKGWVRNRRDGSVEAFFAGDYSAAIYQEARQQDARAFDLRAGHGVHIPSGAPHWVRNGDNVSVALSINYELRSIDRLSRIFRMNQERRAPVDIRAQQPQAFIGRIP